MQPFADSSSSSASHHYISLEKRKWKAEATAQGSILDDESRDTNDDYTTSATIPRKRSHGTISESDSAPTSPKHRKLGNIAWDSDQEMSTCGRSSHLACAIADSPHLQTCAVDLARDGNGDYEQVDLALDSSESDKASWSEEDSDFESFADEGEYGSNESVTDGESCDDEEKLRCPELPTEVWERVIDFVAVSEIDYHAGIHGIRWMLKTCAKVCLSWHNRSLFHLRRYPVLVLQGSMKPFFDAVRQFPYTPDVKMDLCLHDSCQAEMGLVPFWLTRNRAYSKSITFLRIQSGRFGGIYDCCHPNFLMACKSSFSNVATLALSDVTFVSASFVVRFLFSFRSLAHLFLRGVRCNTEEINITHKAPNSKYLHLRTLYLDLKFSTASLLANLCGHVAAGKLEKLALFAITGSWMKYLPSALPSLYFLAIDSDSSHFSIPEGQFGSKTSNISTFYLRGSLDHLIRKNIQSISTHHLHTLTIYYGSTLTGSKWDDDSILAIASYLCSQKFANLRYVTIYTNSLGNFPFYSSGENPQIRKLCSQLVEVLETRGGKFTSINRLENAIKTIPKDAYHFCMRAV